LPGKGARFSPGRDGLCERNIEAGGGKQQPRVLDEDGTGEAVQRQDGAVQGRFQLEQVILDDTDGSFSGDAREHTTTAADSCAPPRGDCDRERLSSSSERERAELCQARGRSGVL
jgi:hypothetical protein